MTKPSKAQIAVLRAMADGEPLRGHDYPRRGWLHTLGRLPERKRISWATVTVLLSQGFIATMPTAHHYSADYVLTERGRAAVGEANSEQS